MRMRCPSCGKEIPDDAKFCPYCGAKISDTRETRSEEEKPKVSGSVKFKLKVISGPHEGEEILVVESGLIGRDPANARYPLPRDRYISRKHARVILKDSSLWIEDVGSTNGSFFLSGESWTRINPGTPYQVQDGVPIKLGNTVLVLERS